MALIECKFFSEEFGMATSMNVILPEKSNQQVGIKQNSFGNKEGKFKVLYLLHGYSDDHSMWIRQSSIERYAAEHGIAVIMPAAGTSYYTNMAYGKKYWNYISEEVPRRAREFFPISENREDNFVAGLSMGGYGALKLGLMFPEKFCAVASLSGALDIENLEKRGVNRPGFLNLIFGQEEGFKGSKFDLQKILTDSVNAGKALPKIYQCCGTEDFLYKDNLKFKTFLKENRIKFTYHEEQGAHEWEYWNRNIKRVLDWMLLR